MKATGGGGAGGAAGGAGGASGGGGAGGASGGAGGGGGAGGAASPACMKLCMGADSIGTVCMAQANVSDSLKNPAMCLGRCAKETMASKVTCWQDHVNNAKAMPAMVMQHCGHAAGMDPCDEWPE
jgi:hypothetical protein